MTVPGHYYYGMSAFAIVAGEAGETIEAPDMVKRRELAGVSSIVPQLPQLWTDGEST